MITLRKKGEKTRYSFRDADCLGRKCFLPGNFDHYNTSISGAISSTHQTAECINRAYNGCNLELNHFDTELMLMRKKEGYRVS